MKWFYLQVWNAAGCDLNGLSYRNGLFSVRSLKRRLMRPILLWRGRLRCPQNPDNPCYTASRTDSRPSDSRLDRSRLFTFNRPRIEENVCVNCNFIHFCCFPQVPEIMMMQVKWAVMEERSCRALLTTATAVAEKVYWKKQWAILSFGKSIKAKYRVPQKPFPSPNASA